MKNIQNILLINPPFPLLQRYGKGMEKIGTLLPPLGLGYLAAVLEQNNYKVKILDSQVLNMDIDGTIKKIKAINPGIIGITVDTGNFNLSLKLSEEIKKQTNIPIIFGGPHPSLMPHQSLKNTKVDYVVIGEGEITIVELLNELNNKNANLSKINGIAFKENNKIVITKPRAPIQNLDEIPYPARHLFDLDMYKPSPNQYKRKPMLTMITSRGCPYTCSFCSSGAIWGRRYRYRSVKSVIEEIKYLIKKFKAKEIGFWDDIFGLNKKWMFDFCDELEKEKIDITWCCEMRVNMIDEKVLRKMKKAGCWVIFYGVESLDQEILDAIDKKTNPEMIIKALTLTSKVGIETRANYMLALPKETPEKVRKMLKIIKEINSEYVKFNIFTPYPGTKLYNEIKQGKWGKLKENLDDFTGYNPVFVPFGYISLDEVKQIKKEAFLGYYIRPRFILKRLMQIRSFSDLIRNIRAFIAIINI